MGKFYNYTTCDPLWKPVQVLFSGIVLLAFNSMSSVSAAPGLAELSDGQFRHFSTHSIDVRLDGKSNNTTNSFGTFSPSLKRVPAVLRETILTYEKQRPTAYTPRGQALARCELIGTALELDNLRKTKEWFVTTRNGCSQPSRFGLKTFWLVQQTTNPRVIMADYGQRRLFIPKQAGASGYRPVSLRIKNSAVTVKTSSGNQSYKANCKKQWDMRGGRYTGKPESIEIWAVNPATNSKDWVNIRDAFPGNTIKLPSACQRF